MKDYEKREIEALPERYRTVGAWTYFGWTIAFSIPFIGFILLIITACGALGGSNVNVRSFARSYFCVSIIVIVVFLILIFTGALYAIVGPQS